ncbi:YrhK family protein [Halalkalibacter sp. APA_J-10(15)]|uniref:YrhK family protein n=1 Tax=Halalkalibacter sp. APA_J-10(15) TaxID=2933805 RepID=UPI001FF34BAE|nr:YrhK family protein [Halalkalibacter sp. APA_J-10(15)]MCK0472692.1 YrhK family protein [Halalkalibacter sp. APA_J-10(15)]
MKNKIAKIKNDEEYLDVKMGRVRIYFDKRYRVISTINDLLIGVLFVIGSILNFFDKMEKIGLIFYLAGSTFLVVRPVLRLMHSASLRKEIRDKGTYTPDNK